MFPHDIFKALTKNLAYFACVVSASLMPVQKVIMLMLVIQGLVDFLIEVNKSYFAFNEIYKTGI